MLFNSLEFIIFFPLVFALYWMFSKSVKAQNLVIVGASSIFYAWVDWRFLFLILLTSLSTYFLAFIGGGENLKKKKIACIANALINLFILGIFKYYNFFVDNISALLENMGLHADMPTLKLILPVGISFYTFKAISYSVDVYRGNMERGNSFLAFLAYLMFFPQLLAGPIERAVNLYPQFLKSRIFDYKHAIEGSKLIIWGLFKKIAIADTACNIVDPVFSDVGNYNSSTLLVCAVLYTFQIYGDFSGYSDMAIGIGRLLGIKSKKNFNLPYLSRDVAEFWKRWHISLNTWFVQYVYIPLGGNRISKYITIRNTFVIFLLSGLWHGANWTFIVWGLYHAILFVPLLLLDKNKRFGEYKSDKLITMKEWTNIFITFILVMFGWIIFRSVDIQQAYLFIINLLNFSNYGMPQINMSVTAECFMAIIFMSLMEIKHKCNDIVLNFESRYTIVNTIGYALIAVWAILFYSVGQTFIYFQF